MAFALQCHLSLKDFGTCCFFVTLSWSCFNFSPDGPFYYSDIFTDIKRNVASGWGAQTLLPSGNLLLVLKEHATMFLEVDSYLSSEETVMTQKSECCFTVCPHVFTSAPSKRCIVTT